MVNDHRDSIIYDVCDIGLIALLDIPYKCSDTKLL